MTDPMTPMPRRPSEPDGLEKRADFRAMLARRVAVGAIALALLGLLVTTTYTALTISDRQQTNTRTLDSSAETLKLIRSCTTPGQDCFVRGQKRTAAAVGDINRVVILAAACSVGLDTRLSVSERQTLIQSCVIDRLAASRTTGP